MIILEHIFPSSYNFCTFIMYMWNISWSWSVCLSLIWLLYSSKNKKSFIIRTIYYCITNEHPLILVAVHFFIISCYMTSSCPHSISYFLQIITETIIEQSYKTKNKHQYFLWGSCMLPLLLWDTYMRSIYKYVEVQ